ncbi:hypothetical protein NPIL_387711 [Nephila pilipes]|uniref:Uncharacterized protein n=1 Tax=Nephila pilipes TaxID=299642 RepID=A0A8X6N361_NEPPI|nr:hypothetical protein NPIL_387711 [Nephila pilipes]
MIAQTIIAAASANENENRKCRLRSFLGRHARQIIELDSLPAPHPYCRCRGKRGRVSSFWLTKGRIHPSFYSSYAWGDPTPPTWR